MSVRALMHRGRDIAVRFAANRHFVPIEHAVNRLLVIRPDHFGDLLMLEPALRYLHENAVAHEIVLMVGSWNESVARHIAPYCQVEPFDFPGFERNADNRSVIDPYRAIGEAAEQVRQLRPQLALLMRDDHWWGAWMSREAGVPLRVGYEHPLLEPFMTHPLRVPAAHYVEQNLILARSALMMLGHDVPEMRTPRIDYPIIWHPAFTETNEVSDLLQPFGITGDYVVLHPGTGASVKLWPSTYWTEVVDRIMNEARIQIVLTGSADDRHLCEQIAENVQTPVVNLAGKTTLPVLAEVLRGAWLTMGVDSGPLHLATAVGTRTIHLYGPSDHVRYGPWGDPKRHRIIRAGMACPSCGDLSESRPAGCGCMIAITVDEVSSTALEMLRDD